jgi:hypothetical protein
MLLFKRTKRIMKKYKDIQEIYTIRDILIKILKLINFLYYSLLVYVMRLLVGSRQNCKNNLNQLEIFLKQVCSPNVKLSK